MDAAPARPDTARPEPLVVDRALSDLDCRALLRASPNPYVVLDCSFTIVAANDAYLRVTGHPADAIIGRGMFEAFPDRENEPQLRASFERVLRTRRRDTIALIPYAISRDGGPPDLRYWSATHTPVLAGDGSVSLILQHTVDVTELQQLRAAAESGGIRDQPSQQAESDLWQRARIVQETNLLLDAERDRLQSLFAQAPGFMAVVRGPDHVFEMANAAYLSLIGRQDIIGRRVREVLWELEGQGFYELLDKVYRTGTTYSGRDIRILLQRHRDPDPAALYLDFVYQPLVAADGSVTGVFVQGHDVTEKRRAQDELELYRTHLEDLVRERTAALAASEARRAEVQAALLQAQKAEAIGQLTGGVAHDFNNLLQALSGCLQMLSRRIPADDDRSRTLFAAGQQAIDRGAKLTQQLMAFARRQALRPEAVDVHDRILSMSGLLSRALRADIRFDMRFAPGLWPAEADPTQFELAVLNLAVNARDAMPAGGQLVITASNLPLGPGDPRGQEGDYVRVEVADTGTGMSAAVRERAFDPFFTTKAVGKGTGLGLSQVYGFARQSGGQAWIDSEEGRGTRVTLLLPRSQRQPRRGVAPVPAAVVGGGWRVLLVEDDPVVAPTVCAVLEDLGYSVRRTTTADEALILLQAGEPVDLLFTDVVMPGALDGVALARAARAIRPDLPVVLTTGYSEEVAAADGLTVLPKPYQVQALAAALDSELRRSRG